MSGWKTTAQTMHRGHMVNLHADTIATMRDNLAALPWWAWRRRMNIRTQLAAVAVAVIRDQPHQVATNALPDSDDTPTGAPPATAPSADGEV